MPAWHGRRRSQRRKLLLPACASMLIAVCAVWLLAGALGPRFAVGPAFRSRAIWSAAATPEIVPLSVAGMQRRFALAGYQLQDVRLGAATVPRLFLARLPADMPKVGDPDQRKTVFIKALLPLILAVDEAAAADRARLLKLLAHRQSLLSLDTADRTWLQALAHDYGGSPERLDDLLARVDIVPPSLALAQAAEETGWGTSHVVLHRNALFGQQVWSSGGGGASIRSFEALGPSVAAYIHNLNTHPAYAAFRARRAELRREGRPLDSDLLARALLNYSERRADYIAALRRIIRANALGEFDGASLRGEASGSS